MAEKKTLTKWKLEDIVAWCAANNQLDWLEAENARIVEHKIYPKMPAVSPTGKKTWRQDTSKEPEIVKEPQTFNEIRYNFYTTFIEPKPKKEKEPKLTLQEKIAAAIKAAKGE